MKINIFYNEIKCFKANGIYLENVSIFKETMPQIKIFDTKIHSCNNFGIKNINSSVHLKRCEILDSKTSGLLINNDYFDRVKS